jgi:hypothetical protein
METSRAVNVVVASMAPYIGETMARSAAEAHCRKLGLDGQLSAEQLEQLLAKLASGLNIFLGREKSATVIASARQSLVNAGGMH